ncbi:hypothetical protein HYV43_01170 [Candidatus Micrarchaeota archaeon]|nr:hypothetical protein [Candidatus Micrarchaeota archaeon]
MHLYILGRLARTLPTRLEYEPCIHFEVHDRKLGKNELPGPSILEREPKPSEVVYHFGRPGTTLNVISRWVRGYLKEKGVRAPIRLHIDGFDTGFEEGMRAHLKDHLKLVIQNARLQQQVERRKNRRHPTRRE